MTTPSGVRLDVSRTLTDDTVEAIAHVVARATEVDGVHPLSEHVMLQIQHGGDDAVRHLCAWIDDSLVAYASLELSDGSDGSSAELVVDPQHRDHGIGTALLQQLRAESPDGRVRVWAHGDSVAAARLAEEQGFARVRVLRQMRRPMTTPVAEPRLADGVTIRTFRPGADDAEWLAVNATAFADHPEQGAWTQTDLDRRLRESWFDADGFFLAEQTIDGAPHIVGFHWTKVHAPQSGTTDSTDPTSDRHGEIYVIGVLPEASGRGLGRALALVGLRHLHGVGVREVLLYVEATNTGAIALYESLGFSVWGTDVMYAAPARPRLVEASSPTR